MGVTVLLGESAKPVTVAEAQGLQVSLCYPRKVQAHKEVFKNEKTKKQKSTITNSKINELFLQYFQL